MTPDRDRETRLAEAREEIAEAFYNTKKGCGPSWNDLNPEVRDGWLKYADRHLVVIGPVLTRAVRDDALRRDLAALAEEWDAEHADWCCQRGCPHIQSVHPGPVEFTTDAGIVQIGPDELCPGTCTCYVGLFRDRIRALLDGGEGGR